MSKKFTGVRDINGNAIVPVEYNVDAGAAATISVGMLVEFEAHTYVKEADNGAVKTDSICGIAASDSDETATADGTVLVYRAPLLVADAVATTPANLAATVRNTQVTLDVSGTDHTIDENDTTNGFIRIRDYDDTTNGNCTVELPCTMVAL